MNATSQAIDLILERYGWRNTKRNRDISELASKVDRWRQEDEAAGMPWEEAK